LQVGDRLLSCSAVFGDEMWHAQDLQRTRWAINNRPGKVGACFVSQHQQQQERQQQQ
jgi:hypothetical protein